MSAELVARARAGESAAWAEIYDLYGDRLYDYAAGILRDSNAAADAVQDTFIAASQKLDQLRDPDKLRPWLYAITRNASYRIHRRRRRERPVDDMTDRPDDTELEEPQASPDVARDLVGAAAGGLNERDRELLDLHLRHGLDGPELAAAAGVSQANPYSLMNRVRAQLDTALTSLLVARHGADDCDELANILRSNGFDGELTVLLRKRVNRHVKDCDECGATKKRVVAAYSGTSVMAAPAALRDRVLGSLGDPAAPPTEIVFSHGWPVPPGRRRLLAVGRRGLVAAACVVLVMLGGLALMLVDRGSGPEAVADDIEAASLPTTEPRQAATIAVATAVDAESSTSVVAATSAPDDPSTSTTTSVAPSSTTVPPTTTSAGAAEDPVVTVAPHAPAPAPAAPAPDTTVSTVPRTTGTTSTSTTTTTTSTTTSTTTTTTTTTLPPPPPPVITSMSLNTTLVCQSGGVSSVTVSATVTNGAPRASAFVRSTLGNQIADVNGRYVGVPMQQSGSTWTMSFGPWSDPANQMASIRVDVTDAFGQSDSESRQFEIRDFCIG